MKRTFSVVSLVVILAMSADTSAAEAWLRFTNSLMLAIHILSVEALLILLPFTKLFHAFSVFVSRWYNGDIFGRKGVAS